MLQPKRFIYPIDWYPVTNENQQKMNELFVYAVETYLGVIHTQISVTDEWNKTAPKTFRGTSLEDFLGKVSVELPLNILPS